MSWLVRGDRVLASLEVPTGRKARARGLVGRDTYEGAMLLERCRSVHTFGMRFAIDVAFIDRDRVVVDVVTLPPRRVTRPRLGANAVVEARSGCFERWGLVVGDELEVRE
jgi:uncharacterized membrane protein (UPF0127 family)